MKIRAGERSLPSLSGLVAGGLVTVGVLLWMFAGKAFLFVAWLGAFGPGLLRELGVLRDQDEFQRQAAYRAGYHAYLIAGLAAVVVVSVLEWRGRQAGDAREWLLFIIALSWLSWMFSALLAYWGAGRTASRVLIAFGSFWLVFGVATVIGELGTASNVGAFMVGVLAGLSIIAPFFVLAWTADRWPRLTGAVLLVVSAAFVWRFGGGSRGGLNWSTVLLTQTLLVVPMAASGIALLRESQEAGDRESDDSVSAPATVG